MIKLELYLDYKHLISTTTFILLTPQVYKKLLDLFPKGKMIPTNVFQVEFMHYPKQQQCAIDCLEQMETNGKDGKYSYVERLTRITQKHKNLVVVVL